MFAMGPIPPIGGRLQAIKNWLGWIAFSSNDLSVVPTLFPIALADIGLVDLRHDDYVQAMGRAGAGPGFALRPVLTNVVACDNHVTRAAEGASKITCR